VNKYYGIALCCGQEPIYRETYPCGFQCLVCKKEANVLISDVKSLRSICFAANVWNEKNTTKESLEKPLNIEEGWRWGTLNFQNDFIGGSSNYNSNFILFKTEKTTNELIFGTNKSEYIIDNSHLIQNIELMGITGKKSEIKIPTFSKKSRLPISIYVTRSYWVSSGEGSFNLIITTMDSPKWFKIVQNSLNFSEICFK